MDEVLSPLKSTVLAHPDRVKPDQVDSENFPTIHQHNHQWQFLNAQSAAMPDEETRVRSSHPQAGRLDKDHIRQTFRADDFLEEAVVMFCGNLTFPSFSLGEVAE